MRPELHIKCVMILMLVSFLVYIGCFFFLFFSFSAFVFFLPPRLMHFYTFVMRILACTVYSYNCAVFFSCFFVFWLLLRSFLWLLAYLAYFLYQLHLTAPRLCTLTKLTKYKTTYRLLVIGICGCSLEGSSLSVLIRMWRVLVDITRSFFLFPYTKITCMTCIGQYWISNIMPCVVLNPLWAKV